MFEGDNLVVLRGMNSDSVDLIYLDPPFNSKKSYAAPVGSRAAGAYFKDTWTLSKEDNAWHGEIAEQDQAVFDIVQSARTAHSKGMKSYLIMMAVRLLEMKRVLKETGSIYLHVDPTASHYLKMLMDAIFGHRNFRNEIVWWYGGGGASRKAWGRKHDTILFYTASNRWTFNVDAVREEHKWDRGQPRADGSDRDLSKGKLPDDVFHLHSVMPWSKERTGYPTQKPEKLLERIIAASSNEGDMVLDPFCGCATALVVAEGLKRQWIGIDLSAKAVELVRIRLQGKHELALEAGAKGQRHLLPKGFVIHGKAGPMRTDQGKLKPYNCKENKDALYGRQQGECNGCTRHFEYQNMVVDHIDPRSRGGGDQLENLQLLCGHCNSVKGDRSQAYLKARLKELRII